MKIKEFAKTSSGGTPKSTIPDYYEGGTIPWINSGELSSPFISHAENFITEEGYNNSSTKLFPPSTILLAMYGATAGKVSMLEIEACTNQAICAIMPDESKVNPLFLKYKLDTLYKYLVGLSTGSARDNLSQQGIGNLDIELPDLPTQDAIASVLSSLDRKIALNRKANELLESMAKQLYDYWFVQFDFPNEEGKPYKSSEGKMVYNEKLKRDIPEGWEVKTINEISKSVRGVTYDRTDLLDDGILVLRGNNIQDNHLVYDGNTAYIPEHLVNENQTIKKGDIIMTMSSGSKEHIGKCMMFNYDSKHTFGAFLNCFRPNVELQYYFFLFLISKQYKAIIKRKCSGTGINNLTNQSFDDIYLPIPSSSTLSTFETKCRRIYEMYGKNEQETLRLTSLRDYLLPLLMNGQVKVS